MAEMTSENARRPVSDPAICGGRPVIRGTRIRVRDILDLFAANASRDEILADYPQLEDEDITAALSLAQVCPFAVWSPFAVWTRT